MIESEDDDPVGPPCDPVAAMTTDAVELGIIRPGDKLDQVYVDLCMRQIDRAAVIGDQYADPENPDHTAGDHIRAELYE